jgi:hypothetical protein
VNRADYEAKQGVRQVEVEAPAPPVAWWSVDGDNALYTTWEREARKKGQGRRRKNGQAHVKGGRP